MMMLMVKEMALTEDKLATLQAAFGNRLERSVSLSRFSAARVGGPADGLIKATSLDELVEICTQLWQARVAFILLGGGSNVLISDAGVRGVVVLNQVKEVHFLEDGDPPKVWAASGANLGVVARQAAAHGMAGLEWAAGIPGTIGGAVVGNAGAHGGSMASNLVMAEILHREERRGRSLSGEPSEIFIERQQWTVDMLDYSYRSSRLKHSLRSIGYLSTQSENGVNENGQPTDIVLAAMLQLTRSSKQAVQVTMDELTAYRRQTQPPGASLGSMFKNPPGDYAGRLIEAAGLKGARRGGAQISQQHANFFINLGHATAQDIWQLIQLAKSQVAEQFGIQLELEIELIGSWETID
jgi:UDP-N-acetylmuramate dehydrogenase